MQHVIVLKNSDRPLLSHSPPTEEFLVQILAVSLFKSDASGFSNEAVENIFDNFPFFRK